jgi:hypothetical protein
MLMYTSDTAAVAVASAMSVVRHPPPASFLMAAALFWQSCFAAALAYFVFLPHHRFHGCCCEACQSAPRLLRPIKVDGGNYGSWGNYADVDSLGPIINTKRTRE